MTNSNCQAVRMVRSRKTIADAQALAAAHDGKCISTDIINTKTRLEWQCKFEHELFLASYNNVAKGHWCSKCAGNKKKTLAEMKALAAQQGGRCLSASYQNSKTKLLWQCELEHELFFMRANNVQQGQWCPECSGKKRLTLKSVQLLAEPFGGKCVSKLVKNSKQKLKWQCAEGHLFERRPNDIQQGYWCTVCQPRENRKKTLEDIQELARSRGGECLSTKYDGNKTELKWRCAEGHEFYRRPNTIQQGAAWCTECTVHLRERLVRACFEEIFNDQFPKTRPSWLLSDTGRKIELDGFNKRLSLAFEHHGEQHYRRLPYFQRTPDAFRRQLKIDELRRNECQRQGVTLIEIPYTVPVDDLFSHVLGALDELRVSYPPDASKKKLSNAPSLRGTYLKEIRETARKHGLVLISHEYKGSQKPLKFECLSGHQFMRRPANLNRGATNCPHCIGIAPFSIEFMRAYSRKRNAECLSTVYENNKQQLEWRCRKHNHVFSQPWNKVSTGRWCRFCK